MAACQLALSARAIPVETHTNARMSFLSKGYDIGASSSASSTVQLLNSTENKELTASIAI
jgi:hypothetical protein